VRRLRVLAAVALVTGSLGYVVAGGLRESVVYYVTPTELHLSLIHI
jgi:cytochrome c-type biogenesis protein CcmE